MWKPFRIRNLYFNSADLLDWSGVVQLSPQQYDHEVQACPEAIITYVDEDDGEIVTVSIALMYFLPQADQKLRLDLPLN